MKCLAVCSTQWEWDKEGEDGILVCGVRNPPLAQRGWTLGILAERRAPLTLGEAGKVMGNPQPYPRDNGLPSLPQSSPFFEAGSPVHIMTRPPQRSSEVGAAAPGGPRRPGQGSLLEGACRIPTGDCLPGQGWKVQEELVIIVPGVWLRLAHYLPSLPQCQ